MSRFPLYVLAFLLGMATLSLLRHASPPIFSALTVPVDPNELWTLNPE